MKVLVVGATGGSGRAAVTALLAAGHDVTAVSRHVDGLGDLADGGQLRLLTADATRPRELDGAVQDQDAVIITLGISESAVRVRLRGAATTPMDVRSRGTRNVIDAMRRHDVRKLVVQTSYGVGPTRDELGLVQRMVFALLLAPQIADTERQEGEVRASGLDWVIVQPVNLTDDAEEGLPFASTSGETNTMKVARSRVGRFLADAATSPDYVGCTVALSGAAAGVMAPAEHVRKD